MTADLEPIETSPSAEAAAASPARRRPRWLLPVLLFAVVALVIGGVVALATRDEEPSPDRLLADASAFAKTQKTAAFTGQLRIESKDPDGGSFINRAQITGTARLPDQAQYMLVSDGFASEVIALGDRLYTRDAERGADLRDKKWAASEPDAADQRSGVVRSPGSAPADVVGEPIGVLTALDAASRPFLVRRDGKVSVIKADVDVAKAYGAAVAGDVGSSTVELTLDDDRVDRIVLTATGEGGTVHADYRFTKWGGPVVLKAPAAADLDPTPGIEEEEIAAFKDTRLLQPRGIPAGWVLDFAGVLPKEMTVEGCEQVELDYIEPNDPDNGYLTLYELPKSCADLAPPRGSQPFTAGRSTGWVDESRDGATAQILVGDTVIQAETDLPLDGLVRILSEMAPLNLAGKPAELPGFAQTTPA